MFLRTILDRWSTYVGGSPLRRLGSDALIAAGTSFAARGASFAKEIVVAAYFGLSGNLDIYIVAFTLIGFPLAIILNAVQTAFIAKLASDISDVERKQLYGQTVSGALLILLLLLPLWLLLIPHALPWLASGFPDEKRLALETALFWLIPYYFICGLNLLGYGVLQAKRRYLQNGLLPAITPLIIMLLLLMMSSASGWRILVASLVVATVIEGLVLLVVLFRAGCVGALSFSNLEIFRPVLVNSLILLPGTVFSALSVLVDQAIAASQGEGSNAALLYGYKLPSALQSLFVTAIGITALPYFASQVAQGRYNYCLHSFKRLFWLLGSVGIILAIPLAIYSSEIISLLYYRGNFDVSSIMRVAPVQTAYFIQIPFALLAMLGIKTLVALDRNSNLSWIIAIAAILQGVLAYTFVQKFGIAGIAWAAVIISAMIAITTFIIARKTMLEKMS